MKLQFIKSTTQFYNKLSNIGKLLVLIAILLATVVFFKYVNNQANKQHSNNFKEGMTGSQTFLFKEGTSVYDDFYADIYDHLVFNGLKNNYEIGMILKQTSPTEISVIADIGCGTGHQVKSLSDKNLNVLGIDISPSMINMAKKNYPENDFQVGDALDNGLLNINSVTHILCFYFTIYYFKDKRHFFDNCMDWLMPGGYLCVHMVDRENFDPILPPGNPLYIVSPQKYAKERITKTKVTFNDFLYQSEFNLDKENNLATFDEKFKFHNGKVRKQQQKLYMEDTEDIVNYAQNCGFILQNKIDMVKCAYEHQFLYIFVKPN